MVNSGSSANLVLIAGLKRRFKWADDDEILVSPVGFATTISVLYQHRLKPVFVDIEWDTLNFDLDALFNIQYGYETGLNSSMARHVESLASDAVIFLGKGSGLRILDIGSNDGTLLNSLMKFQPELRIGVDPNISKLKEKYNQGIVTFSTFYDSQTVKRISEQYGANFDLITSIAMFYDLIDPNEFVLNVKNLLSGEGIWVLELSNLFSMLRANSLDTVCHEHLEYYSAFSINVLLAKHNLKVVRFEENQANGGSMQLYISHSDSLFK
jgi:2-polyprenyl-3-methyl-5-hydroxy-6-metoxy-1,4-benzoquinol methylase